MRIVLLGFMTAGKSTLGPVIAREGGLSFVDLDAGISVKAGQSIAGIFRDQGEAGFRRLEAHMMALALAEDEVVIAPGGGLVESWAREEATPDCHGVYLYWPWEILRRRLAAAPTGERPLRDAGEDQWRRRFERRDPLYRRFSRQILAMREAQGPAAEAVLRDLAGEVLSAARGKS